MTDRSDLLGSPKLYQLLAERMAADEDWTALGKELNFSMTHVYEADPELAVSFGFRDGALVGVTEGRGDAPADFVLSGPIEVWERMLISGELTPQIALMTRQLGVEGPLSELISRMDAFNHLFDLLAEVADETSTGG